MINPREYTHKLLEMVDSGILSSADVMNAALLYMSESDVEDMIRMNQWDDMLDEDGNRRW